MEMKTCFPFLVNPAGSFLKGFICLLCSKEFGEKISVGDKYLSKAVQNFPGRRLV